MEQELRTLPEHLSSPPILVGLVLLDLFFDVYRFVLFILVIVLCVLLWFTYSGYPFGILKLFLLWIIISYVWSIIAHLAVLHNYGTTSPSTLDKQINSNRTSNLFILVNSWDFHDVGFLSYYQKTTGTIYMLMILNYDYRTW